MMYDASGDAEPVGESIHGVSVDKFTQRPEFGAQGQRRSEELRGKRSRLRLSVCRQPRQEGRFIAGLGEVLADSPGEQKPPPDFRAPPDET